MPLPVLLFTVIALGAAAAPEADTADDLIRQAKAAFMKGKSEEALALAAKAVKREPRNADAWLFRGTLNAALRKQKEAVADFSKALQLDPKRAEAYDRRGSEYFKLGQIDKSLADFDRFLELRPDEKPGHWRRGITLYYAGKFDEGRKQFEAYEQKDTNDVENAVWHYICYARVVGPETARKSLLKIGQDRRVPLMVVYDLFAGKAKPQDVLAAAEKGKVKPEERNQRLFYAHLYLGLYYESAGDKKKALEHLAKAADDYKMVGHYMWEVARVGRKAVSASTEK